MWIYFSSRRSYKRRTKIDVLAVFNFVPGLRCQHVNVRCICVVWMVPWCSLLTAFLVSSSLKYSQRPFRITPTAVYTITGAEWYNKGLLFSLCSVKYDPPPPPKAQQPLVGQGLLIIEASRSHSDTWHSIGFWMSDQSDAETSTWQHVHTDGRDEAGCCSSQLFCESA